MGGRTWGLIAGIMVVDCCMQNGCVKSAWDDPKQLQGRLIGCRQKEKHQLMLQSWTAGSDPKSWAKLTAVNRMECGGITARDDPKQLVKKWKGLLAWMIHNNDKEVVVVNEDLKVGFGWSLKINQVWQAKVGVPTPSSSHLLTRIILVNNISSSHSLKSCGSSTAFILN